MDYDDYLAVANSIGVFPDRTIITSTQENATRITDNGGEFPENVFVVEGCVKMDDVFNKGKMIKTFLHSTIMEQYYQEYKADLWILHTDVDIVLAPFCTHFLSKLQLLPQALYYSRRWGAADLQAFEKIYPLLKLEYPWSIAKGLLAREGRLLDWSDGADCNRVNENGVWYNRGPYGFFQLFNYEYSRQNWPEDLYPSREGISGQAGTGHNDLDMIQRFKDKLILLPMPECECMHIPHGESKSNWLGRKTPRIDYLYEKPAAKLTEKDGNDSASNT